jgi:natural resistance-associated macrophage protein
MYTYYTWCSVCLPTVLIPIIKLSTSSLVLSKEFRPSTIFQIICWILAAIVVAFDIYLFMQHATDLKSAILIGVIGTLYILFLIYLVWKPLENNTNIDGWMSLPQNENDLPLIEQEPTNSKPRSRQHAVNNSDSEEIYPV